MGRSAGAVDQQQIGRRFAILNLLHMPAQIAHLNKLAALAVRPGGTVALPVQFQSAAERAAIAVAARTTCDNSVAPA